MNPIVGIDLGTTNSAIAIMEDDEVKIIPNKAGENTTPSVVAFLDETTLVGMEAKNQATTNPKKTIASIKRVIGRRVVEISDSAKKVSYTLVGRPKDPVQVLIGDKPYMPQIISAKVLLKLKKEAEDYLGKEIKDAVVTVPAYFNDGQRQATKLAGEIAGFNVKRIINEPTAAALAYGIGVDDTKKVAVFDLGGGTFDISILEIGGGVWEVKATNGDTLLGGDDFDKEIINLLVRAYLNKTNIDLREHAGIMQQLKEAAEEAKHDLSKNLETNIALTFIINDKPNQLDFTLTRSKFESLIQKYLKRIQTCCKQALKDSKLSSVSIDDVVLVGGSTRIPIVKDLAKKLFDREPNTSVNPDEVVALGAAIQGAILSGEKKGMVLIDVTPLSLGIETEYGVMDVLIRKNTAIPCIAKDIYTTTEEDQTEVDVYVFQGESRRVSKNRLLGRFVLDGIEETCAGDPQIEVRFAIDADGILQVSARNTVTGSEQHITIKGSSAISEEEIKKLQEAALNDHEDDAYEDYEDDDDDDDDEEFDFSDLVELAETILRNTTEGLEEFSENLEPEVIEKIKKHKENLAMALDDSNEGKIEKNLDELITLWDTVEESLED